MATIQEIIQRDVYGTIDEIMFLNMTTEQYEAYRKTDAFKSVLEKVKEIASAIDEVVE